MADAITNLAGAVGGGAKTGPAAPAAQAPTGPQVRVSRGNNVTLVSVGAK
jgi:hypothetical protein